MGNSNGFFMALYIIFALVAAGLVIFKIYRKISGANKVFKEIEDEKRAEDAASYVDPDDLVTEQELFEAANNEISRAKDDFSLDPQRALMYYRRAAAKIKKLMEFDRGYYQKYLYTVYDEMGIIYYNKLAKYSEAYECFATALENCRECADRAPDSAAARDVEYISLALIPRAMRCNSERGVYKIKYKKAVVQV